MRVVVTGQVGVDKKPFLHGVVSQARQEDHDVTVCSIGEMMYAEAPDVAKGRILDLPLSRLNSLRRSVFKDVLAMCGGGEFSGRGKHLLVNTHATFRWRHGLFYAFDYDQMKALAADLYVVLVDDVDQMHCRLRRDRHVDHTLKDLMVWREEEILATELLSQIVSGHGCFYVCARGHDDSAAQTLMRLICRPHMKKAYLSFPMTHVSGSAHITAAIDAFRREMKRHFTCFDPGDLEERNLGPAALQAAEEGRRIVESGPPAQRAAMETRELIDIIPDIDGQIYARDFKLIDQSDMIISLIPVMTDGRAAISSGVERELQHAHEATKDVFVIWQPKVDPSPFITETATRVFPSVGDAVRFFLETGYTPAPPTGTLFG